LPIFSIKMRLSVRISSSFGGEALEALLLLLAPSVPI